MPHLFAPTLPFMGDAALPPGTEHYRHSPDVRELLVLLALSSSTKDLPDDLREALPIALEKVTHGLRQGLIQIDYRPAHEDHMDIPAVNHPHYMQALLYWRAHLGCSLERLVEAHARLGSAPSVENVMLALEHIEKEDALSITSFGSTHQLRKEPATMPLLSRTKGRAPESKTSRLFSWS